MGREGERLGRVPQTAELGEVRASNPAQGGALCLRTSHRPQSGQAAPPTETPVGQEWAGGAAMAPRCGPGGSYLGCAHSEVSAPPPRRAKFPGFPGKEGPERGLSAPEGER